MAKPIPQRSAKIHKKSSAKRKKLPKANPRELRRRGWMVAGFDTSMSSIAAAAIGYDVTLNRLVGPEFLWLRWQKEDEYLDRLMEACRAEELIHALQNQLGLLINNDEIYIAQEEPVPMGLFSKGVSAFLKQQCEVSGAFLGGLMRYGYRNIFQINSTQWRQMVAQNLGITIHHSKWKSPELCEQFNCKPKDSGKFRSKQWALGLNHGLIGWQFPYTNEIPDWPDIIEAKHGKVPRPEGSKAKAVQPDDRYDALAVMMSQAIELQELGEISLEEGLD
jgi:hypothetical protein